MSEENLLLDDVGYETLDYMDYQWPIAEGFEMRGDEVIVVLSDEERERIKDYIVEHRTRQIPVNYLQQHLPEVFDKLIDVDEYAECDEQCDEDYTSRFQYMHPYDMRDYDIIVKDDILEEAFDIMPMDEYVRYQTKNGTVVVSREGQTVSGILPMPEDKEWSVYDLDLMALSIYRLEDGKWKMDKDLEWLEMTIQQLTEQQQLNIRQTVSLMQLLERSFCSIGIHHPIIRQVSILIYCIKSLDISHISAKL